MTACAADVGQEELARPRATSSSTCFWARGRLAVTLGAAAGACNSNTGGGTPAVWTVSSPTNGSVALTTAV